MAWRVTNEEVRAIIDDDSLISVTPFIDTATALTDRVAAQDSGGILSVAILKEIEKYLAAFFYSLRDPGFMEKKTGDASAVFDGQTGLGLDYNRYGQQAKMLDETGFLDTLSSKKHQVAIGWLGLPPSEQTDYVDRD